MTFQLILLLSAILMALIAGLFYAYSCSVNPGLGRLPDEGYLRAMQSINRAILNPWFFASFMGTLVMTPLSAWLALRHAADPSVFDLLLAAFLVYAVGVFGVTAAGNVPLNQSLDRFDIASATPEELRARRLSFESPWNRFHRIRTICNAIALVLTLVALLRA